MPLSLLLLKLGEGMLVSIEIFCLTLIFSLPLGLLVAFGRMARNFILSNLVKFYISVMRGTPLMLQLMVVYFGPYYIFASEHQQLPLCRAYRLFLNYAAYFAKSTGAASNQSPSASGKRHSF